MKDRKQGGEASYIGRRKFLTLLGSGTTGTVIAVSGETPSEPKPARYSTIHDAIDDLPPDGGEIYLSPGKFDVATPIILKDNVSLLGAGRGATVLKPTSDIDAVSIEGNNVKITDLQIRDIEHVQETSHGLTLNGSHQSVVSDIVIAETANGLIADSDVNESGDVWENSFRSIHVRDTRGYGFKFQGEYHDNSHVDLFANRCAGDGFIWKTKGVDGGNKYIQCISISCELGFRITSAQELWLDQILADSNRSTGLFIDGGFDGRLFGGQFWTSTNGNNGLELSTRQGGSIEDVYIDQLYSWQNQNFGLLTDGQGSISRVVVGTISTHHNQVGTRFEADHHKEIWLQWLHSRDNSVRGVDGSGGYGVNIGYANALDGWKVDSTAIRRWCNIGIVESGEGKSPNSSYWNRGDFVENRSDGTLWIKSIATGKFIRVS